VGVAEKAVPDSIVREAQIMSRIVLVASLAALPMLASCGGSDSAGSGDDLPIGGQYAQCDGRAGGGQDRSDAVMRTIQAHAPNQDINCTDKQSFTVEGRQVFLVFLAHGPVSDCPAGCFSADLCAIYDAPQSLLYDVSGSTKPDRPGLAHPVVQTQAFQSFRAAQRATGPWRFCFRGD
jgi:hypothetical protein